jgi:hypothetical protein
VCDCNVSSMVKARVPSRSAVRFSIVDKLPDPKCHKGCTMPDGRIYVDRRWWASASSSERDACLAHEMGHSAGADCERCADYAAGAILRRWGYSSSGAVGAMSGAVRNRNGAGYWCGQGWHAAGASTGAHSFDSLVSQNLQRRLPATKPSLIGPSGPRFSGGNRGGGSTNVPTSPGAASTVDPGGPSTDSPQTNAGGSSGGGGGGGGPAPDDALPEAASGNMTTAIIVGALSIGLAMFVFGNGKG